MRPTPTDIKDQFDYDAETGTLIRKRIRASNIRPEAGSVSADGYMVTGINGTHQLVHRLIWVWVYGSWPPKQVEHINGDKTDNRLVNLRLRQPAEVQPLTVNRLKEVLNYSPETGEFRWKINTRATTAGNIAGCLRSIGYRAITIDMVTHYAHRLAILWTTGAWPKHHVDHINGKRDDNKIENLRDVTVSVNSHNTSKLGPNNTTGYRGVAKYMDKYIAQIMVAGEKTAIGMYKTPQEASAAYQKRCIEIFGELPKNDVTGNYDRKSRALPEDR